MSLAILVSEAAIVFERPRGLDRGVLAPPAPRSGWAPPRTGTPVCSAMRCDDLRRELRRRVQARCRPRCRRAAARRGAACTAAQPGEGVVRLLRVARELLAEADRHRVLQVGAADLDHVVELLRLAVERRRQRAAAPGSRISLDRQVGGDVDGGRDDVVARLPGVDVVVGVDRLLRRRSAPPRISIARLAITSLAFMLVEVAEPVWKMSSGNCSSSLPVDRPPPPPAGSPRAISAGTIPSSSFTAAASPLIIASAAMKRRRQRSPETGKLRRARSVCAP